MFAEMTLGDIARLPGIRDLNSASKVKFIKALKAEETGDYKKAEEYLNEAIILEADPLHGIKGR